MKRKHASETHGDLTDEEATENDSPRDLVVWGPAPVGRRIFEAEGITKPSYKRSKRQRRITLPPKRASKKSATTPTAPRIRIVDAPPLSQQQSPLCTLPGELRNRIYRLVLVQSSVILDVKILSTPTEPALLATCQRIRKEALNIFYSENTFHFDLSVGLDLEKDEELMHSGWLASLGKTRCGLLEDLRITTTFRDAEKNVIFESGSVSGLTIIRPLYRPLPSCSDKRWYASTKRTMEAVLSTLRKMGVRYEVMSLMDKHQVRIAGLSSHATLRLPRVLDFEKTRTLFKVAGKAILTERLKKRKSAKKVLPHTRPHRWVVEVLGYRISGRHDAFAKQRQILEQYLEIDYHIDRRHWHLTLAGLESIPKELRIGGVRPRGRGWLNNQGFIRFT